MDVKKIGKEKIIIAGVAIIIVVIAIVAFVLIGSNNDGKVKLEDRVKEFGERFYVEKYYPMLPEKQKLADYRDTGVNVSITDINVAVPLDEETTNALNDNKCNLDKSVVVIYPEAPYGEKNYNLKVELSCEK